MSDAVSEAAIRLERAVERLSTVLASRPSAVPGVPVEGVAALSARLDETLSRLRSAVAELEGQEAAEEPPLPLVPPDDPQGHPPGDVADESRGS
ncbi:hypothetical protein ACFOD4_14285 [Pseudoroseomonas globiformis]|uniref:Uncharacterized protein n=1 Tax=Teichococcus globiformis TaxID=2307229 RepID=A0ABV7G5D0_9PROT